VSAAVREAARIRGLAGEPSRAPPPSARWSRRHGGGWAGCGRGTGRPSYRAGARRPPRRCRWVHRPVPAGGHDRKSEIPHQQVVERGIRQHDPEAGIARCDGVGNSLLRSGPAAQENDRCLGSAEQRSLRLRHQAERARRSLVRNHQCKGFFLPVLALSEHPHRLVIARIRHELETPIPLSARTAPDRTASAAARSASSRFALPFPSGSRSRRWGPHAGHATGCA